MITTDRRTALIALAQAFLLTLAALAVRIGHAALPAAEGNRLLAVVNRDTIRARDLDRQIISAHTKMSREKKSEYDYEKLLGKAINDRLIVQEAMAMEMHRDERLLAELAAVRERLALARYLKQHYRPDVKVGKAEIAEAFDHYYRKLQIRTLALPTREAAAKLIEAIGRGASMDSLARESSLDSRKYEGGLHPLKHYADVELVLREQAEKLAEGALSAPFAYRKAFAFLRLEKAVAADRKELPAFEKKLKAMLTDRKNQAAWEKFVSGVKAAHALAVDQAGLARIAADSAKVSTAAFLKGDSATVIRLKGGGRVTDADFRKRVSHYVMGEGDRDFRGLMDKTLASLSAELALNAAAKAKGFHDHPEVNAAWRRSLDSSLIEAYLAEMVVRKIKFNKQEFDGYYHDHLEDFREPDQFILSEIHVSTRDSADAIVARLKQGADFKFLMKQVPSEERLVDRNATWVTLEALPAAIRRRLLELKIGQHSEAFQSSAGWVILKVDNRKKGGFKPLEEAEMKIREVMFQKLFAQRLDAVLATLRANASITYNQEDIRKYFGKK